MKTALITGITGQDGSYLADLLVEKGYKVYGLIRRTSSENLWRVHHLHDKIKLIFGDLLDQSSLVSAIQEAQPEEIYNLAAQSFVPTSWSQPVLTGEFTALGVTRMLEAIRAVDPNIRFYQASSSEMFGKVREIPQTERHAFLPAQPVRRRQGVRPLDHGQLPRELRHVRVLGNSLQPRVAAPRPRFVTRKITYAVARIKLGLQTELRPRQPRCTTRLGLRRRLRQAMWAMLQRDEPDDYVVATGETHSVGEFVERAFQRVGLDWQTRRRRRFAAPTGRGRSAGRRPKPSDCSDGSPKSRSRASST